MPPPPTVQGIPLSWRGVYKEREVFIPMTSATVHENESCKAFGSDVEGCKLAAKIYRPTGKHEVWDQNHINSKNL